MIPFKATQGALDAVRLVRFVRSFCVRPNQIASKIAGQPINAQGGYLPYTEWDFIKNICKEKGASNKKWDCVLCDGKYSGGPARIRAHLAVANPHIQIEVATIHPRAYLGPT